MQWQLASHNGQARWQRCNIYLKLWPCRLLMKLHCLPKTRLISLSTRRASMQLQLVLLKMLGPNG